MWYEALNDNFFIKKLYKQVPELIDVNIYNIRTHDEGNRISIVFDLPYYADYPPKKWIDAQYKKIIVQVDFCAIQNLYIEFAKCFFLGNIEMAKDSNELITIDITGSVKANIIAEAGRIQFVKAYHNNKPEF